MSDKQLLANKALANLRVRLLDLTARNRLINFRHTKAASLRIIDKLPNQLLETLLADAEMRFSAIPEPTENELIEAGYLRLDEESGRAVRLRNDPTASDWAIHLGIQASYEVPETPGNALLSKHSDNAIQTLLYPYEMEAQLKSLSQLADSAAQEMGANILYLVFGFLEWYESSSSDVKRLAPLFLVPARLCKGRLNPETRTYDYTLSYSGEEIIPNLSLREKLRADFGLALPELDETTIPENYFAEVRELVEGKQPRWCVRRFVSLALLNFSKLLMYLDLDPERWPVDSSIVEHRIVSRFLANYGNDAELDAGVDFGFGEEYPIDEVKEIHAKYPLIDDADSSQHSALIDVVDGKDLVIEGPPGTGKSQTITNLIAAAMAQGKKVLFVAEKLAALEVVRRRLDAAGLGEFCLELHSHKSQKRKILDDIDERLKKHGKYRRPKDLEVEIARYEELKTELNKHVEMINRPWKNTGKSLHEILMAATRYRNAIGGNAHEFYPDGYDGSNYTAIQQRSNEDHVEAYRVVYQAVAQQLGADVLLRDHPWFGVGNGDLQVFDRNRVMELLAAWQATLPDLRVQLETVAHTLGCEASVLAETVVSTQEFLNELGSIPPLRGDEIMEKLHVLRGDVLKQVQGYLQAFEGIQELYASLSNTMGSEGLVDLVAADQLYAGCERLTQIVGRDVKLARVANALNRLAAIEGQLCQLGAVLQGVSSALGESAAKHLTLSKSGLVEMVAVIDLVASLNPSYWKHRDDAFDNDELDELLPRLRRDLGDLRVLHGRLHGVFSLERLPGEDEIKRLNGTLASGGIFKWLKADWRAARKTVRGHAVDAQVKYSVLVSLLDDLASYSVKQRKLVTDSQYSEVLGGKLRGLDTDLAALEALRVWYKRVRQRYGVGFGPKVTLGNAILNMSPNVAKAVRSLVEQNVQKQVDGILGDLSSLKEVFSPYIELQNAEKPLVGETGTIPRLRRALELAVKDCRPMMGEDSISVADLEGRIQQIRTLKARIEVWQKADIDRTVFQGGLGLRPGVNVDNKRGLSTLRHTLEMAAWLAGKSRTAALVSHIYAHPSPQTILSLQSHAGGLRRAVDAERSCHEHFAELVKLDPAAWGAHSGARIDELISRNQVALANGDALQSWLDYVRVRDQLKGLGLTRLADAVDRGDIKIGQVGDAYRAGIFDILSREILHEIPELGRFSGHSQQALQDRFKEYDIKLKKLQSEQIAWSIDQQHIPAGNAGVRVSERTERVLLEHECSKKTRHLPIRQLLLRAGNALVALKPCFMMGPMSVAQYLAPGGIKFDLVVMDEASQIKPQDALGAVARGAQLVVVGDPKQLPPTSFFDRAVDDEEEDPTAIEESESILDATLPMFQARRLRWHYRSQHESLIAFSNQAFYESSLILFPSPNKQTDEYGIQYARVKRGCFVNRRNLEEARIISEAVREHFRYHQEETLGVVAMNAEQRLQIEWAIETLAKDDAAFQEWLDRDAHRHEPLFIKNLENVQGDERDVIFISMTYGPEEPGGKVYQRFGPINSDVGWRRLNVLFTRSKKRMHIFSSMGPEDIVVGKTSKRGIQALRDFLSYCETGILHRTIRDSGRDPDSDFEVGVTNALRDAGFECVPQVGVAGFYIDVAVIDPGNPGRYLMGVECDGATYHSAKSVRDRDRLRQAILERLGWRIRRIWSTDWFKNPQGELGPIIRELNQIKSDGFVEPGKFVSEVRDIGEIIQEADTEELQVDQFVCDDSSLRDKLIRLDTQVIRKEFPNTPSTKRLLRPAMLEALLEYSPTSKAEFLQMIPAYIRQATEAAEGKYLEQVFEIINASLGKAQ